MAATQPTLSFSNTDVSEILSIRVQRLELTLKYIASVAGVYCSEDSVGKRFATIRDTALAMVEEEYTA